jgi:hypothetical protein
MKIYFYFILEVFKDFLLKTKDFLLKLYTGFKSIKESVMEKTKGNKNNKNNKYTEEEDLDLKDENEVFEALSRPLTKKNYINDVLPIHKRARAAHFWYWNIYYTFTEWLKTIPKFQIIQSVAMFLMFVLLIGALTSRNPEPTRDERAYGTLRKMQQLKKTHTYYSNLSEEEIYHIWKDLFLGVRYQMDGNLKYKTADCVGGVFAFLQYYGYAGQIMNVNTLNDTITKLNAAGLQKIRQSIYQCKPGDIIIFNPINGIAHVGIVECVRGNYILYVDINGAVGPAENWIQWNDAGKWGRINKIAEVSYPFWCGDVWKEYSEKNDIIEDSTPRELPANKG